MLQNELVIDKPIETNEKPKKRSSVKLVAATLAPHLLIREQNNNTNINTSLDDESERQLNQSK